MNDYCIARKITLGNDLKLFLLPVRENLKFINRDIIPRPQQIEINRYKFQHDVDKRLLARTFCYEYIREYCQVNDFELDVNSHNKPFFKTSPHIHFSFSYAKEYLFVGISTNGKKTGVDIEFIDPMLEIDEIAPEIMCSTEHNEFRLHQHDSYLKRVYFFRLFSAKESIIKAFGTGLYFDVTQLNTLNSNIYMYQDVTFVHQSLGLWNGEYTLSVSYQT